MSRDNRTAQQWINDSLADYTAAIGVELELFNPLDTTHSPDDDDFQSLADDAATKRAAALEQLWEAVRFGKRRQG